MITRYQEESIEQICESVFPQGVKATRYLTGRYGQVRNAAETISGGLRERFDRCVDAYDMTKWKAAIVYDNIYYRRSDRFRLDQEVKLRNTPVQPALASEDLFESPMDCESIALVNEASEQMLGKAYAGYLLQEA